MANSDTPYPPETLSGYDDDGTMPQNVAKLAEAIIGHRIASTEQTKMPGRYYGSEVATTVITLDNGRRVTLLDTDNCCAFTELKAFLLHPEMVDHIITGVGTTDGYSTWHIYADYGDILELQVGWSCGNPFYYGYGFEIRVENNA